MFTQQTNIKQLLDDIKLSIETSKSFLKDDNTVRNADIFMSLIKGVRKTCDTLIANESSMQNSPRSKFSILHISPNLREIGSNFHFWPFSNKIVN